MPEGMRGGTMTRWRDFGTGDEPLLALHCGLGQSAMFRGLADLVGDRFALTAPDLPGHGRSGPWQRGCDPHDQATAMARDFAGRPMHLLGHSFGATVALRLALESPEHVASLTLIEPVFFAAASGDPTFAKHRAAEEAFFAVYETEGPLAAARVFNRLWGGGVPWASFSETAQAAMAANMAFVVQTDASLWQDCHGLLEGDGLEALSAPTELLRGSETLPIMAAVHRGLLSRLPDARETVVPSAGHMLLVTHPETVAKALENAPPL